MQISPKKKDRCQISDMRTGRWLLCWSLAACVCVSECVYGTKRPWSATKPGDGTCTAESRDGGVRVSAGEHIEGEALGR